MGRGCIVDSELPLAEGVLAVEHREGVWVDWPVWVGKRSGGLVDWEFGLVIEGEGQVATYGSESAIGFSFYEGEVAGGV